MRVIEPAQLKRKKRQGGKRPGRRTFMLLILLLVVAAAAYMVLINKKPDISFKSKKDRTVAPTIRQPIEEPKKTGAFKTYTAEEFHKLYQLVAYPNVQEITTSPDISGNKAADDAIIKIAVGRGFALRSVPVQPIVKTGEPNLEGDDLLQPKALEAWQNIKAAAAKESIPLHLLSGYRSIEYQRNLFLERLQANGGNLDLIAGGGQENIVNLTLNVTAPPGYSRHHTGYTVDFSCLPYGRFVAFKSSVCDIWIKAGNYAKAKQFGWIPSYPDGADKQGPEPEPWEFVWVGTDNIR